jgi:hypothetical protein
MLGPYKKAVKIPPSISIAFHLVVPGLSPLTEVTDLGQSLRCDLAVPMKAVLVPTRALAKEIEEKKLSAT